MNGETVLLQREMGRQNLVTFQVDQQDMIEDGGVLMCSDDTNLAPNPVYHTEGEAPNPVYHTEGDASNPVYHNEGEAPNPVYHTVIHNEGEQLIVRELSLTASHTRNKDVRLHASGRYVTCHRWLLSAFSPLLRRLLFDADPYQSKEDLISSFLIFPTRS